MQKITQAQLMDKAVSLLANGTVNAVLGWCKGEFGYDVTPKMFKSEEDLKELEKLEKLDKLEKNTEDTI